MRSRALTHWKTGASRKLPLFCICVCRIRFAKLCFAPPGIKDFVINLPTRTLAIEHLVAFHQLFYWSAWTEDAFSKQSVTCIFKASLYFHFGMRRINSDANFTSHARIHLCAKQLPLLLSIAITNREECVKRWSKNHITNFAAWLHGCKLLVGILRARSRNAEFD